MSIKSEECVVKFSTTRGHTTHTKHTNKPQKRKKKKPLCTAYILFVNQVSISPTMDTYTLQYNTCYDYELEEATARAVVKTTKHDYHHPPTPPPPPPPPPRKPRHAFLFLLFVVNSLCSVSHTAIVFGFIQFFSLKHVRITSPSARSDKGQPSPTGSDSPTPPPLSPYR